MPSVFSGIRVPDLSQGIAGPIAGMLLADHGAAVTKIEAPGGDRFRSLPGANVWLRGRRSAELDLAKPADHRTFLELVRSADIVLESFTPGYGRAARRRRRHPAGPATRVLIHCSITGYGRHPAHRDRPAYDALVAARLGLLWEQRGYLGGPIGPHHGNEPFWPIWTSPPAWRPDHRDPDPFHPHPPAEPVRRLPGHHRHQRRAAAPVSARAGASTSRPRCCRAPCPSRPASGSGPSTRAPGLPHVGLRQRASKGFFLCSDGRWVHLGAQPPFRARQRRGGHPRAPRRPHQHPRRRRADPARRREHRRAGPLLPGHERGHRPLPVGGTDQGGGGGRGPPPTRPHPRGSADRRRLVAEGAVVDVEHPATDGSARWGPLRAERDARCRAGTGPPCRRAHRRDPGRGRPAARSRRAGPGASPAARNQARLSAPLEGYGARPRSGGGRSVRHPGAGRSRRQRHQDQRSPGPAGMRPTSPMAATAASAASASTSRS